MLYVATVHYESPRWIEIQARYLRRNIQVPFETWASIEGIDPSYAGSFTRVLEQRGEHAGKLNHLAREITYVAADDDLIMFLDGDAFPIADPMPVITGALERAPLLAVRRAENIDEPQPHPCFCVTTVATWRSLPGDWSLGPVWPAVGGKIASDVGANLLRTLELSHTPWEQLLRTNGTSLHPLYYAIYGDIVYHHGSGFRDNVLSRAERELLAAQAPAAAQITGQGPARVLSSGLARVGARSLSTAVERRSRRGEASARRSQRDEAIRRNSEQSREIFEAIERDDPGWLARVRGEAAPAASA